MLPQTRYAKSGGVNIAYQVVGDGPIDLVLVPGWVSNIDVFRRQRQPHSNGTAGTLQSFAVHVAMRERKPRRVFFRTSRNRSTAWCPESPRTR